MFLLDLRKHFCEDAEPSAYSSSLADQWADAFVPSISDTHLHGKDACSNVVPFFANSRLHSWGNSPLNFSPDLWNSFMMRNYIHELTIHFTIEFKGKWGKQGWKRAEVPKLPLHPQCVHFGVCSELLRCSLSPRSTRQKRPHGSSASPSCWSSHPTHPQSVLLFLASHVLWDLQADMNISGSEGS